MGIFLPSKCSYRLCCQAAIKKFTFSSTSVLLSTVKCTIVLVQINSCMAAKNARRGYRLKIYGTSFVCNEPGKSILCPHVINTEVNCPTSRCCHLLYYRLHKCQMHSPGGSIDPLVLEMMKVKIVMKRN